MATLLGMAKPKLGRGRGRPRKEDPTTPLWGRVTVHVADALEELAWLNRRTISAEVCMAAEDRVLDCEDQLRQAGKWTPALDRLKAERRPHAN